MYRFAKRLTLLSISAFSAALVAAEPADYSPYLDDRGHEQVLFGDTHLHTVFSSDAGLIGTSLTPADAYRFAMGEEVTSSRGIRARISRPLDFLVVSDHAESLGLPVAIREANATLLANPWGKQIYDYFAAGDGYQGFMKWALDGMLPGVDPLKEPSINFEVWGRQADLADQYNRPGRFTALIGFEWTTTVNSKNLHRVVVLRDDSDKATQVIPFSSWQSPDPEKLWDWMDEYEAKTGGSILAIPHNANLSNGLMFGPKRSGGRSFDEAYVERRLAREPIVEVTQIKGDGESHPWLSPDDEFADFGNWDRADIGARDPKTNDMLQYEYARGALKLGLQYEAELGTNPFQFGMIGASDSHTALATTREENYFGKFASHEPLPERVDGYVVRNLAGNDELSWRAWDEVASGLAGVWAVENTREAIFDALQRREVYATTGTRIRVRMFAGWDYAAADLHSPDMVRRGYARGVPMGSEMKPGEGAPVLMIQADKDPDGANLDRVQVVKGWLDASGELQEKVYDVALSDGRELDENGKAPPVGNTVNLATASYSNSIGAVQLSALWSDPDFDASERAFYYVRVLEIPTPSWQAFDRVRFGSEFPEQVEMVIQDRAYTSPVWYSPG